MVDVWRGRIVRVADGAVQNDCRPAERFVGVPRMNALCRALAESLPVAFATPVAGIVRADGAWHLRAAEGRELGRFERVIVTTPPAQAVPLLAAAPGLAREVAAVEMHPCWANMVVFDRRVDVEWDGAFVSEPPLSWVARNASKPGRPPAESWVLHATPEWSAAHIEADPLQVGEELIAALFAATGAPRLEPILSKVHRWRYAKTARRLAASHLYDPGLGIGVAGDWCGGDRVEDAYLSGLSLAREITAT
jgi:predicted NAD/FAD-dependent oxidoreductase